MKLEPIFIAYAALLIISLHSLTEAVTINGFSIDLIHRDSLQSPLREPSLSPPQRRLQAIRRSFDRIRRVNTKHSPISAKTEITNSGGEYLMKYSVGMPPVPALGIIDTGSDLIWTQCSPCLRCFNQKLTLFTPNKSSTYARIPCNASACTSLDRTYCSKGTNHCLYSEYFDDGSSTQGEMSMETITFCSTRGKRVVSAPNVIIGCGFSNKGIFVGGESGVVGLGGGKASLLWQLGSLAQGKFSYCLVPQPVDNYLDGYSGKLSFGAKATVSGKGVVTTPLVTKDPQTFYFLTLKGVSVGGKTVEFFDTLSDLSTASKQGNMMIDSGTTLTFLPNSSYIKLVKLLTDSIKLKPTEDPLGALDLCFFTQEEYIDFPPVVFHFEGGAGLRLKQDNLFFRTSYDTLCLAAKPVPEQDVGIYGNLAQINFLVGYDLEKRSISFWPTHCGRR
ncbi:hypothetical protein OROHE_005434 [Orobanche hederae]